MKKKFKKNIFNIHKDVKHPIIDNNYDGDKVTLRDRTEYIIQSDRSWRKNE